MGLYDDDDAAVTDGPCDDENYYYAKIWDKWLATGMKFRLHEASVKRICMQLAEFAEKALAKFPQHKELIAFKDKANKLIGKIETSDSQVHHDDLGGGWHQEVYRKGWADGLYALYLKEQSRVAEAKKRAENSVLRLGDWMKEPDYNGAPSFPKAELEETVAKVKPIAA